MFQAFRDRRTNKPEELAESPTEAILNVLEKRQLRQNARQEESEMDVTQQRGAPPAGAPKESAATVAAQLGMVARQAASIQRGPREPASGSERSSQTLTVGSGIQLKGEITNCDTLIVEGHVEGSANSGTLQIAEGGAFIGDAEIETAVISGHFDGQLTASSRLVIRATGRVSGTIRYAAIAIEAGGQIAGDVQVTAEDRAAAKPKPGAAEAAERAEPSRSTTALGMAS